MPKQTALLKNKDHILRPVMFGIMCFLTLLCIAVAVKNDIFRDRWVGIVNIIILCGLLSLTLLTGFLFLKEKKRTGAIRFFTLFLLNMYISCFFSSLMSSHYHQPGRAALITILYSLSSFFFMALFLTLWLYLKQFLKGSARTRVFTVLIAAVLFLYTAALVINLFRPILFQITEQGVFSEEVKDYYGLLAVIIGFILLCIAALTSCLSRNRKLSYLCCILLPLFFGFLSLYPEFFKENLYLWGIICFTVVIPLCLIFFNAHDELENDVIRQEKELTQLQVSAMISQMQPHFLVNSLAVISALCEEDPRLAAEATNTFSNYLRENINCIEKTSPISFTEELNHIKTYVWLEKLRFPNKLNVEYDINCTTFPIPALSVQPMVENAIKYGICKSKSGGTVRICSFETEQFYCVTVSDDGIGFDPEKTMDDGKQHLGIKNTRYRIREMVGGSLDIVSEPGKGTVVTIKIPKKISA